MNEISLEYCIQDCVTLCQLTVESGRADHCIAFSFPSHGFLLSCGTSVPTVEAIASRSEGYSREIVAQD